MSRTLVKTTTAGWYIDADDPDGNRVRKADGDRIITRDEFDAAKDATPGEAPAAPSAEAVEEQVAETQAKNAQTRKDAAKAAPQTTTLTSGKVATGATVTIRDAWVDPEARTKAQAKLFENGFEGVEKGKTYEAVVKAANKKAEAMPSGEERVIKKQDAFQVRFSPDNQKKWRNELRRRSNAAKRAARQAAAK